MGAGITPGPHENLIPSEQVLWQKVKDDMINFVLLLKTYD